MKTSPGKWIASCLAGSLTKSAYVFTHAPFKLFIPHWDSEIGRFFALYEQSFLLPSGSFIYKPHWPLMLKVRGGLYSWCRTSSLGVLMGSSDFTLTFVIIYPGRLLIILHLCPSYPPQCGYFYISLVKENLFC